MSFSCTIKAGTKDLTKFKKGSIHYQLSGLGPNGQYATGDPYSLDEIRSVVQNCSYGNRLKEAAQDCFREIQRMAKANLDSLREDPHCETCECDLEKKEPVGWSIKDIETVLAIDAKTITYVYGGW